jgi:hypothetical protein
VLKLQKSISLSPQVWVDVSGTLGANTATIPITNTTSFFRLTQ